MKKCLPILFLVLLFVLFASCDKGGDDPKNDTPPKQEDTVQTSEQNNTDTKAEVACEIIDVNKGIIENGEWYEDTPAMLARCRTSYLTLGDGEREKYPSLAKSLDGIADLCKKSHRTDFENLIYLANEELQLYDGFTTQVSTLDMHIRRSDSVAFSMLSDSYMNTTHIQDFRAIHGTSYDTETGTELKITDVVKDMPKFAQAVEKQLFSHMWGGELLSENAVKDYFDNRTPDGISWSLDYNGVTVYFNKGDIAEPVYGIVPVTVSFTEYSGIFEEKYTKTPEAYTVKLPLNCSSFLDLDNNNSLDEFIVTAHFDEVMGMYSDIYLITSGDFYEESICAYGFNPYYVKTSDGRHLLYLFIEGSDSWHRLMNLYVYDISGTKTTKIDEIALAPHHDVNSDDIDVFTLPTNPQKMYLDYFVNQDGFFYPSFAENYTVGSDGLPERSGDGVMEDYPFQEDTGDESIAYSDSEYRTEYANALDFDSFEGTPYFAVSFIGYGDDITSQRNEYVEELFSSLGKDAVEKIEHFEFDGDEWYLIVPRYKEYVDVKSLDGGKMYTSYGGEPFTVKCNVSDLYSNIEIVTDIHGGHSFSPQMGGDGKLITSADICDITDYNR